MHIFYYLIIISLDSFLGVSYVCLDLGDTEAFKDEMCFTHSGLGIENRICSLKTS